MKYFRLNVYSKELYNELLELKKNPRLVLKKEISFQTGFLQGIFDAEGSVRLERKHITISSNSPATIEVVSKLLDNLGIKIGKPFKDKNNVISIPFYGLENLTRFRALVGFRHPNKSERLELLLKHRL